MKATNLDLIGENKYGQTISKRIYCDDFGNKYVAERISGGLRRKMIPCRLFSDKNLEYSYIMTHSDSVKRCMYERNPY